MKKIIMLVYNLQSTIKTVVIMKNFLLVMSSSP